ncbi:MAG: glycosyltransferase family 2 protein [Thermodesulfovibrio sp.]|nr:glycosyltransferase family 2 protein [Thermodesulfovibrio sp.]
MWIESKEFENSHFTTRLKYKLLNESYLNENGVIKPEYKFTITLPEFKIKDSKVIGKPDDKFETMLFLPEGEGRKGEGGLRTKGYFKFSYKLMEDGLWYMCDLDGNPVKPAPEDVQESIKDYLKGLKERNTEVDLDKIRELPLITVITVVLNGEKYFEETIESVINQTYPNVEYVIIDGGSTDNTLNIINKYGDYIDYWVSEKDCGLYYAMNKGLRLSLGRFYIMAGDSDKLLADSISNIIHFIDKDTDICICAVFKNSKRLFYYRPYLFFLGPGYAYPSHSVGCIIKTMLHKKEGLYDTSYKVLADSLFIGTIIKNGYKIVFQNVALGIFDTSGISSKLDVFAILELFRMNLSLKNSPKILQILLLILRLIKNIKKI